MPKLLETVSAYFSSEEFTRPRGNDALPSGFSSTVLEADSYWPWQVWRDELIARLRKFPYPYLEGRRYEGEKRRTLYERVEAAGILDSLLNGELLWTTHLWFVSQKASELEEGLRNENISRYYCPTPFHRQMIKRLMAHITEIRELLRKHDVDKEWAKKYLTAADKQLVREVRGIFQGSPSLPLAEPVASSPRDCQIEIHNEFVQALEEAGAKGVQTLANHLTSLVCSSENCIRADLLNPSPEAIRKKIEAEKKKSAITKP